MSYENNRGSLKNVPVGDKITIGDAELTIKKYHKSGPECECNLCGMVTPSVPNYSYNSFKDWYEKHLSQFQSRHDEKLQRLHEKQRSSREPLI